MKQAFTFLWTGRTQTVTAARQNLLPGSERHKPKCVRAVSVHVEFEKIVYQIIRGAKATYQKDEALEVLIDAPFAKFVRVYVDEKELVQSEDYLATEGSTLISLTPKYLNTLSVGTYNLLVQFIDGMVTTEFFIKEVESSTTTTTELKGMRTRSKQEGIKA